MALPAGRILALGLLLPARLQLGFATQARRLAEERAVSLLDSTQARLRTRAAALGFAVREALEAEPSTASAGSWEEAARELVQQEAAYLAAEDGLAAALLHNFARGPLPLLAAAGAAAAGTSPRAPLESPDAAPSPGAAAAQPLESTETAVRRDASGQLFRTVRYCRERVCVARSEALAPGEDVSAWDLADALGAKGSEESAESTSWPAMSLQAQEAWVGLSGEEQQEVREGLASDSADMLVLDGPQLLEPKGDEGADPTDASVALAADFAGSALREAARTMARGMKETAETFNLASVLDVMGVMPQSRAPRGATTLAQAELDSTWRGFVKSFFPDLAAKALRAGAGGEGLASVLDLSFERLPLASAAASESVAAAMGSEQGQAVRYVRHCKSGRCETTGTPVIELDATTEEVERQLAEQQQQQQQQGQQQQQVSE